MNSLWGWTLLLAAGQIPADPPKPSDAAARAVSAFKAEAAEYVVKLPSAPTEKLELVAEPVLRWDNPARTGEDGAIFVWTRGGRPEMIGTIFTYRFNDRINRKHELHSLAVEPLTAEFRGQEVWAPKSAGVKFTSLPGAPAPAATSRQRLTQMKALAREFAASMKDEQGESYQLRLLTQPLLRYEPEGKQVQDGALFSFSLGTDPEVILLLEARAVKEGFQWHYAFARFHYVELQAFHQDREVWRADWLKDISNLEIGSPRHRESVYSMYFVERKPAVAE